MIETRLKLTEAGKIPQDWLCLPLSACVDFEDNKRVPIKETERAEMRGRYPYYGASGIIDYVNDYIFDDEYILLGEDGANIIDRSSRLAFIIKGKCWINNHAHVLKPKKNFHIYYLSEFLESIKYDSYATGAAQPKLSRDNCNKIPIAVPEFAEQEKIAAALYDIDTLISTLEKLIEKKRNIKQGTMQELLSGKRRLEGFSDKWESKTVGELCNPRKGSQINKNDLQEDPVGYPVMNGGISPSGYNDDFNADENTIIISEGGNSCGFVNFMKSKFWAGGHCYILSPQDEFDTDYLYQVLKFNEPGIMALRTGSGLPNIKKSALSEYSLMISPSPKEQNAIGEVLRDMDSEISILESRLSKYQDMKQGMMQQLLTGKIRLI